jgi:hypothetical protein
MNPRGFFQLLRPRSFVYFGLAVIAGAAVAISTSSTSTDTRFFWSMILLAPLGMGAILASAAQEAFHTTFGGILPGLRDTIRRWFILSSVTVSLSWALMVHILHPGIPWFPAWMLAWLAICSQVPIGVVGWRNSPHAMLVALIAVSCVFYGEDWLYEWTIAHPWLLGLAASAGASYCLWLGFDRDQLRRSPGVSSCLRPEFDGDLLNRRIFIPLISSFNDSEKWSLQRRIGSFQQPFEERPSTRQWSNRWRENELWAWAKAAWLENGGRALLIIVSLFPLLNLAMNLFLSRPRPGQQVEFVFYSLTDPAAGKGAFNPSLTMLLIIFALILGITTTAGLQNDRLYPLSRRERAGVCFRSLLMFEAGLGLSWGLIQLAIISAIKAHATAPLPIPAVPWFLFELGVIFSILPLLQWARFIPSRIGWVGALLTAFVLMPVLVTGIVLFFAAYILGLPPAAGLATCTVLPLTTHVLAWYLLRRDYARCDLVIAPQCRKSAL